MNFTFTYLRRHPSAFAAKLLAPCIAALLPDAAVHAQTSTSPLLLRADKIYLSPNQPPLLNGAVTIQDGRISRIQTASELPKEAPVHGTCSGPVLTAGFYNSHVHIMGPQWENAAALPRAQVETQLANLATRHGFTTIVDLTSDRDNTLALQRRLSSGEVTGPRLLTLGLPIYPPNGIPGYLLGLPPEFLAKLPQPESAKAATTIVKANMAAGAVGTKLFVVTPRREGLTTMPPDIARAAADTTHRLGGLVVAHPTDISGVRAAIAAGVDLLAHTTHGSTTPWPEDVLKQVHEKRVAMTPTLKLMGYELAKEGAKGPIVNQLIDASVASTRAFIAAGGEVLFGTDGGYMTDTDPALEYTLLARAGMSAMDILASLTTRPAARWKDDQRGRIAAGKVADLVVLDADPAKEVEAFAKVRCTVVGGKLVYSKK